MSAQHTPGPVKVWLGRKPYTVVFAADGTVSRVTYVNAVSGIKPLDLNGRIARAAIAKATGGAA